MENMKLQTWRFIVIEVTAEHLHEAADSISYDESPPDSIVSFVQESTFLSEPGGSEVVEDSPALWLAYGVRIGLEAARRQESIS